MNVQLVLHSNDVKIALSFLIQSEGKVTGIGPQVLGLQL